MTNAIGLVVQRLDRVFRMDRTDAVVRGAALAALFLGAAALRFFRLGEWGFWGDEYITVERSLSLLDLPLSRWSTSLLFTTWSLQWMGVTEASARMWSAIVGSLTVPVTFLIVRRIRGDLVAWLTSILLAISTWHLYWSQNARFYSSLLLFYTLALLLFHLGVEQDRRSYLAGSLAFLFLAVQERAIGLVLIPVLVAYLLCLRLAGLPRPKGITGRNLALYFGLAFAIVGVAVVAVPAVQSDEVRATAFEWVNTNPLWIVAGSVYYLSVPVTVSALATAVRSLRDRFLLLLSISALLPMIGIALVSLVGYAANRYVFVSLTSWLILSAVFLGRLFSFSGRGRFGAALAVSLIVILSIASEDLLYYQYQNGNRDDWKSAFEFVSDNLRPEDAILAGNPGIGEYYLVREVVGMASVDLDQLLRNHDRVWVVEDMTAAAKWPEVSAWVQSHGMLVREFDVAVRARIFEMNVYLVESSPSQP